MAVYFIHAPSCRLVKIGFADKPRNRFSALQVGCPVKLRPLGVIDGGEAEESVLHAMFKDEWSHGEWFRMTDRIGEYIRANAKPWPKPGVPGRKTTHNRKTPRSEFGRSVRDQRDARGMSQHELAIKAGVSMATVYRVEAGKPLKRSVESKLRAVLPDLPDYERAA